MADMTIDEATADTTITGVEKLPVSDGGMAKSVTTAQLLDFVLAAVAAREAATGLDVGEDGIYVSVDGTMKTLPAETLARAVIDYACALTGIVGPNGNEIFLIDDSGTKKTITLAQITAYITANAGGFFDGLSNAGTMAASDKVMVKQGGTVKEGTLGSLAAFALSTFADFLAGSVNVLNVQTSDKIAVVSGGVTKWMTVAQLASALESGATVPAETTVGNVPTYSNATGGLGTGLAVGTTVRAQGTADNETVPTEAAVRAAIGEATTGFGTGDVKGPSSTTAGKIPTWDAVQKTLKDGMSVVTEVGLNGSDTAVPTEKAVRDAIASEATARGAAIAEAVSDKATAPATTTQDKIPQWDFTQRKLTDGVSLVTEVGATGANTSVPTEKAVRSAIAAEAEARAAAIAEAVGELGAGDVKGPGATTQDKVPQWDSAQKTLKDGLTVATSVRAAASADDAAIPTEKAVRTAIDARIGDVVRHDTVYVPAAAMAPSDTDGAFALSQPFGPTIHDVMCFVAETDTTCEFDVSLPEDWDGGKLRAKLLWAAFEGDAGRQVKWGIGCVALADGAALETAPEDFIDVTDALTAANALQRTDATAAFDPEGTVEAGCLLHFAVRRLVESPPSRSLGGDAILLGAVILFDRTVSVEG